jgi:hypothetical protein
MCRAPIAGCRRALVPRPKYRRYETYLVRTSSLIRDQTEQTNAKRDRVDADNVGRVDSDGWHRLVNLSECRCSGERSRRRHNHDYGLCGGKGRRDGAANRTLAKGNFVIDVKIACRARLLGSLPDKSFQPQARLIKSPLSCGGYSLSNFDRSG